MQLTVSARDAAAIAGVLAMSASVMGETEPDNDTFPGEPIVADPSGVLIMGELEDRDCGGGYGYASVGLPAPPEIGDCDMPDTFMRAWYQFTQTDEDDDSSPLGNGLASALYGIPPYYDFDFGLRAEIQVTGAGNWDWTNGFQHNEIGRFVGYLTWRDEFGNNLGEATFEETFRTGDEIFSFQIYGVPPETDTYDVELDNDACIVSTCNRPDTFLGLFDEAGGLIDTDDDSSWSGNGTASMISAPLDGETVLEWRVTGSPNFDFLPGFPHGQLGEWEMYADFFGPGGWLGYEYIDDTPFQNGDEVFTGFFDVPAGADFVEVFIDNATEPCPCDIDFYTVEGLRPEGAYTVSVGGDLWMLVAALDSGGIPQDWTDWEPFTTTADGDGRIYLGVTGGDDWDFMGWHEEFGPYTVTLTLDDPGCNVADVAAPYGLLDLSDVTAFAAAFLAGDPLADIVPDGLFDLSDVNTFVVAFLDGCPS